MLASPVGGIHGKGSVTKLRDGRLQVRVTWPDGRRVSRYVSRFEVERNPRQAQRKAEKLRDELIDLREQEVDPSPPTLAVWLRSSVQSLGNRVSFKTMAYYRDTTEYHIIPALGHVRLDRLDERMVQRWVDGLEGAPQSIHHYHAVLRRFLNLAMRQRYVNRNVAIGVELPKVEPHAEEPLSVDEARRLFAATDPARFGE